MSEFTPIQRRLVWTSLGVVIIGILFAFVRQELDKSHPATPLAQTPVLPVMASVQPFALTNHLGAPVGLGDYSGKVWLADIIFTRCPGPCARMTERLRKLQAVLPQDSNLKLVSITTDPVYDTPEVLAKYAKAHGAEARWDFLTGDKREILKLAVDSLKLTSLDKEERDREAPNDLFIHSTSLVLVDKQGRLRGSYQLLGFDAEDGVKEVAWEAMSSAVVDAVNQLLKE